MAEVSKEAAKEIKAPEVATPEAKAQEDKKAVKKETPAKTAAKKDSAKKTTSTVKKAPVKKAEVKLSMYIQHTGKSWKDADLFKIAKEVWKTECKKKPTDLKSIELYIKPEENKAYYVMNEETGSFDLPE